MPSPFDITRSRTATKMGLHLSSGKSFNVSLNGRAKVYIIEVEDVLFRHDSAVMLPEAYEGNADEAQDEKQEKITGLDVIRTVFIRFKEFPDQTALIAGHTDTTGKDIYNLQLSQMRANSVLYMMLGNREEWAKISDKKHKTEDIQQILTWVNREYPAMDCDPQGIDGKFGDKSRTATRHFQKNFETVFGRKLKEDGIVGPQTWGGFFDTYQRKLAEMLDVDETGLGEYRLALKWSDEERPAVGCGENWPIEKADEDEYRSRINRRVEILFFDENEEPRLDCHVNEKECDKAACLLYRKGMYEPVHLPVHPHKHPQTIPLVKVPDQPGSSNYVPLKGVSVYVLFYYGETLQTSHSRRYIAIDGKLCHPSTSKPLLIDCDRDAWFYCSHRDDLMDKEKDTRFKKDGSGLPLVGPLKIPCGKDSVLELDIWAQNDWIIVNGDPVDGVRPDGVLMAEWNEKYEVGYYGPLKSGKMVFSNHVEQAEKMKQEKWRGGSPIPLVDFPSDGKQPRWIGTLAKLPTDKAKVIMQHKAPSGTWYVTSFNELAYNKNNIIRSSHHIYNRDLLAKLTALPDEDIPAHLIDALPDPPARCLLPGDICWHNQGKTNFCGAFSFAAAMNYWRPYTNNPGRQNGKYWHDHVEFLLIPYGARTPKQIIKAATENNMIAKDRNTESLANKGDSARSLKLIKLWIQAGVPVLVLVEEEYDVWSLHWKVIVGYDGIRFFFCNSGADDEYEISHQEKGVVYDKAPVGNDVDSKNQIYNKWSSTGGDLIDALSSVDTCTFIPIYPKDNSFSSTEVQ